MKNFTKDNYEMFDSSKYAQTDFVINVPNADFSKVAYADENNQLYVMHSFKGCRKSRMVPVADYFMNVRF